MSLTEPKKSAVSPESPRLGLRPFSENAKEYYFGRDAEAEDLFNGSFAGRRHATLASFPRSDIAGSKRLPSAIGSKE